MSKRIVQVLQETQEPLGVFQAKTALSRLPNLRNIRPETIQLQSHPRFRKQPQALMRAIDLENRYRYDSKRSKLFFGDEATAKPGSIVLVDQITSRVAPQTKFFYGVLLGVRQKGLMSSMVIRHVVMGTGVEMSIPIYSPMVSRITVLRQNEALGKLPACYFIRDKVVEGIDYNEIESMVIKYRNIEMRAAAQSGKSKVGETK